jgi:hypothetical protein
MRQGQRGTKTDEEASLVNILRLENSSCTPDISSLIARLFLDAFVDFVARVHADEWRNQDCRTC